MKTLLLILTLFAASAFTAKAQGTKYFGQWSTNTVAATPVKLMPAEWAGNKSKVVSATIIGYKSARTVNTGTVYVGITSGNDTQVYPVTAGGEIVITAPEGGFIPLDQWYLDVVTDNDGVIILFR